MSAAPRNCGVSSPTASTPCPDSPPTEAGTPTGCTRPNPRTARVTYGTAASCATAPSSTRTSSVSAPARPWRWTRSSDCCSRPPGRRASVPASTRCPSAAVRPASSRASCTTTTPPAWATTSPRTWPATSPTAAPPACCPDASPTSSAWKGPPCRSTRRARRHWSVCTWRPRRCATASAPWLWPVASPSSPRPTPSWTSAGNGHCPRTAAARPSRPPPTVSAGPRVWVCWSSSVCRTRGATGTGCSRWYGARRSIRTVRRTG